jgi:16S rRNA (guanine966-N2)-methyltransferase
MPPRNERVRPTSDKVRQALFNILEHKDFGFGFGLEGARVVDLFAGTGALGLEALSRGAKCALFIDDAAESRALIRQNVEAFGLTGASKIWRRDAGALGVLDTLGPFDLAFLDPPYRQGLIQKALAGLRDGGWLKRTALVIAEAAEDEDVPTTDGFTLLDERIYGDTKVQFLKFGGTSWCHGPV